MKRTEHIDSSTRRPVRLVDSTRVEELMGIITRVTERTTAQRTTAHGKNQAKEGGLFGRAYDIDEHDEHHSNYHDKLGNVSLSPLVIRVLPFWFSLFVSVPHRCCSLNLQCFAHLTPNVSTRATCTIHP